ncbi:MAG: exodeoxyribonuclease VII large subunit, partial [Pseudomonadota bacterium]
PAGLRGAVQRRRVTLAGAAAALRPVSLRARLRAEAGRLEQLGARLRPELVGRGTARGRRDLDDLARRLTDAQARTLAGRAERLQGLARLLGSLSYKGTLERGYAVVRSGGGSVVTRKAEAEQAAGLEIEFADGRLALGGGGGGSRAAKAKPKPPEQGSLF